MSNTMVKRAIFSRILPWLGDKKILLIKGARQTGKTTLLRQIKESLEKRGEATVYFAVDADLDNSIFSDAKLFDKFLAEQYPVRPGRKLYVFLDEFQYIKRAGLFLKTIFDRRADSVQLIISGSSSLEITEHSEFLTGRKVEFLLPPFSFSEFLTGRSALTYPSAPPLADKKSLVEFYALYKKDLEEQLAEFINWGGYPEPALTLDRAKRQIILREIFKTYLEKDVALFLRVENISGFNNLVKMLAGQIGNLVNRDELAGTLGLNKETVRKYLEILRGTFIFSFARPYFTNLRKELSKMPKVYVNDLGIIRALVGAPLAAEYSLLAGAAVENFVFTELSAKDAGAQIYFYRTLAKAEIDFIIKNERGLRPVEVKFRRAAGQAPVIIKNFSRQYKSDILPALIITQDELRFDKGVIFLPAPLVALLDL